MTNKSKLMTVGLLSLFGAMSPLVGMPAAQAYEERDWHGCASEHEECRFEGRREVRFGVPGHWVAREADHRISCSNEAFGTDPAPMIVKHCEVRGGGDHEDRRDRR